MSNKVHSQGKVPFSWENKPGVSKTGSSKRQVKNHHHNVAPLPPPPCPPENNGRPSFHDIQIPLPPCAFQPLTRTSSKKGLKKTTMDDPFLIAYNEVTKSDHTKGKSPDHEFGLFKSNMSIFSCKKSSCNVMEDNIVRLSKVPIVSKSPKSESQK